jgi:hypothetical protein
VTDLDGTANTRRAMASRYEQRLGDLGLYGTAEITAAGLVVFRLDPVDADRLLKAAGSGRPDGSL